MESIDNAIFGSILEKLSRDVATSDLDLSSIHTLETLGADSISAQWIWAAGSYLEDEVDERWEACLEGPVACHPLSCGISPSHKQQENRHLVR
jgi:hypothetical protein